MSLYFGESDSLSEEAHEETYLTGCVYILNGIKLLLSNTIVVKSKKEIDFKFLDEKNGEKKEAEYFSYCFSKKEFLKKQDAVFKSIYFSRNNEVMIISEKLILNICSDPIDIRMYYGDEKDEQRKLDLKTKGIWKIFGGG